MPTDRWTLRAGARVRLDRFDPSGTPGFRGSKARGLAASARLLERLSELQELLYASRTRSVLVVLQAMDTGGKDGTIRHVFRGVDPQGVRVSQFRVPTTVEREHDFLWRVHPDAPAKGEIAIFNRSHYEDVLAARVERLVAPGVWRERYRAINEFERTLSEEGTVVLKFFLLISAEEQRRRLRERLDDPTKHWKFSLADLAARAKWDEYARAFEEMLERTSTRRAPWRVVPADRKWYRDWVVATVLVETLQSLRLKWPPFAEGVRPDLAVK